jgi:viologen exporter family transport system ATP-binding protein
MRPGPVVELDRLSKAFRVRRSRGPGIGARLHDYVRPRTQDVLAVDRLSFSIAAGERVAFIGPNGAGKSTTLKMLAGILHPDAGEARVLGLAPSRQRRQLAFNIGTVFGQRSQLWYQLPARDTFELLGRVYEINRVDHRRRIDALVAVFALETFLDTPVRQLSLGQRMRCEIVASLLHRPRLLFLDEPTIGLDVSAKALIQTLLRDESEKDGVTLLLTSHDTGDMEKMCDRVIVIHGGRLLWDGRISEMRGRYLTAKRVTVWTEAEHLELVMAGVRVLGSGEYRTELEVATEVTSLGHVVDAVLRLGPVRDLAVEDAPLDAVIRAMYRQADGGDESS